MHNFAVATNVWSKKWRSHNYLRCANSCEHSDLAGISRLAKVSSNDAGAKNALRSRRLPLLSCEVGQRSRSDQGRSDHAKFVDGIFQCFGLVSDPSGLSRKSSRSMANFVQGRSRRNPEIRAQLRLYAQSQPLPRRSVRPSERNLQQPGPSRSQGHLPLHYASKLDGRVRSSLQHFLRSRLASRLCTATSSLRTAIRSALGCQRRQNWTGRILYSRPAR